MTYEQVLREVDYIIQNMPIEIQNKIPNDFKGAITNNMDINYIPKPFNGAKSLDEQNISEETKKILALIYRNYIVSNEERKKLLIEEDKILKKSEDEKKEKFNTKDIFNNTKNFQNINQNEGESKIIEFKNEKWYKKFFEKIFSFLTKK